MRRTAHIAWLSTAVTIAACALAIAADSPSPLSGSTPPVVEAPSREARDTPVGKAENEIELAKLRLREGTRLRDVAGRFRQSGDSLTFIDQENREISGLPNLNLERILRMLKTVEEPESITWSVSGTVTEFSGRNFLLISRAVYKAAAPPPAPESLTQPEVEVAPK
jgi:hypothetical protein